jgi:hypothetical protein
MIQTRWKPEYTDRALLHWKEYQREHDVSGLRGKTAAIDPITGRVWIADSAVDIAKICATEGLDSPVYLIRVGFDHFVRKGRRLSASWSWK